jgi:small conductance mechanosensitive channel
VQAKKIIMKVLENFPNILPTPSADIFITSLSDSSIKVDVRFWIVSTDEYFKMKSNVTETLNLAFKQSGIVIPFPQITLSNR